MLVDKRFLLTVHFNSVIFFSPEQEYLKLLCVVFCVFHPVIILYFKQNVGREVNWDLFCLGR